jgi:hypothetical protein
VGDVLTELMFVLPVFCHQGQALLPVPGGMVVPNVIRSPFTTPLPAAFADIVTLQPVVEIDETVVPDGIAPGVVPSRIVMPAVILVVTTPLGKYRIAFPDCVGALVGVPRSVATAHVAPVLKALAADMSADVGVLPLLFTCIPHGSDVVAVIVVETAAVGLFETV